MSRKPKRGYFVRGHFVAEGSELDLELKRQSKGDTDTSKSDLKRESEALQTLGKDLLTLRAGLLSPLQLPDRLLEALDTLRRITDFEGRRRQLQFVGKLMRQLDEDTVTAIRGALQLQRDGSAADQASLHEAEQWRTRLIDADQHDATLGEWLARFPDTDIQQLRALVRQARKDAQAQPADRPGAASRHGRAYRELFQLIRAALAPDASDTDDEADPQDTLA